MRAKDHAYLWMALLNFYFDPKGNVSCFLQDSNESLSSLHSPSEEVGLLLFVLVQASKRPDRQVEEQDGEIH